MKNSTIKDRKEERIRAETKRPERVPMHKQRSRMTIPELEERFPDYVFRYVNETDSFGHRIPRLERAGWQVATEVVKVGDEQVKNTNASLGDGARLQVGLDSQGRPRYAVLMCQLREYYDEDQAAKQGLIDEKEAQIFRTLHDKSDGGVYGEVKIDRNRHAGTPKTF
jgi:hypothetical protein